MLYNHRVNIMKPTPLLLSQSGDAQLSKTAYIVKTNSRIKLMNV